MSTMAKSRRRREEEAEGGDEPPQDQDRHRHPVMSFRPGAALRRAIRELASAERRSAAQVVQILCEEALAARGLWEPEQQ